jgi:hypothetical protein
MRSVAVPFENTITVDGVTYMVEGIFFYNPRIRRYMGMVRDRVTKRFLAAVREFVVCVTCTFESGGRGDWSKNIHAEGRSCATVSREDYYTYTSDAQFRDLLYARRDEAEGECVRCLSVFFLFPQEVRGTTYWLTAWSRRGVVHHEPPPDEYCSKIHFDTAKVIRKVACYDATGRRVRCPPDVPKEGRRL